MLSCFRSVNSSSHLPVCQFTAHLPITKEPTVLDSIASRPASANCNGSPSPHRLPRRPEKGLPHNDTQTLRGLQTASCAALAAASTTTARATIRPSTGQPTNPPASKSAPSPRGSKLRRQDSCSQGAAPIGRPQRQWCLLAPCPPPSLSPGEVPLWRIPGPLMAPPGSRRLAEAVSRHSPAQSPR